MRWGRSTGVSTGSNATFSSPATALPTLAALRSSSLARATSDRSSGSSAVPAAVSVTPRALTRCSNRTPTMFSSSEIATDTADSEIGSSAAAAAIEPRSATATKYSI